MPNSDLKDPLARIAASKLAAIAPAAGPAGEAIGKVIALDGAGFVVRADGTREALGTDSPIFQGDTLETASGAALGIGFVDGTTFTMGADARMVVDEFVFDPKGGTDAMAVTLVEGLFIYVSGDIAHDNPESVVLTTPVATIGIRGTAVAILADPDGGRNLVSLLVAPDDTLGRVVVSNAAGTAVLDEVNETTTIAGADAAPSTSYFLSERQIVQLYGLPLLLSPYQGELGGDTGDGSGEPEADAEGDDPAEAESEPDAPAEPAPTAEPQAPSEEPQAVVAPDGTVTVTMTPDLAGPSTLTLGLSGTELTTSLTQALAPPPDPIYTAPPPPAGTTEGDRATIIETTAIVADSPDSFTGGDGADVLIGGASSSTLAGLGGNDMLDGGDGDDSLFGGTGRDTLVGGDGDDLLDGGGDDDILAPGSGADRIDGGAGLDIILFSDVPIEALLDLDPDPGVIAAAEAITAGSIFFAGALLEPIEVDFGAGTILQARTVMTFSGVEGVLGTPLGDVFRDAGPGHEFDGGAGDDTYFGVAGSVLHYTLTTGGVHADLALGTATGDASIGTDTLVGIRALEGSRFADVILGSAANETLFGQGGGDTIDGRSGNDVLDGDDGNDVLTGGAGGDSVFGSLGNDLLIGTDDLQFDLFDGGPGRDTLSFAGTVTNVVVDLRINQAVARAVDVVTQIEDVTGGSGSDTLIGDLNGNKLIGGAGNDTLDGGLGGDVLIGGAGLDVFVVQPGAFVPNYTTFASSGLGGGVDVATIQDFNPGTGEKLLIPNATVPGVPTGPLVAAINYSVITASYDSTNAGTNAAFATGQPALIFSQSDGVLFFDPNGTAPGYSVVAEIQGGITPGAGDILVV
ncbi:MAG: FecR domain-containing protein [Alphaproteobacteria bacterium]